MDAKSIPQNLYAQMDLDLPVEDVWQIDSPKAAEWAIRKIKEARAQRDRVIEAADGIIAEEEAAKEAADRRCQQTEDFFTEKLRRWFEDQEDKRETKSAYMVDLPSGKLTAAKAGKVEYTRDPEKLIPFLHATMPEMIRMKEDVDWAELKKHLQVVGGLPVLDTGEIVDGITVEEKPPEFKVKL